MNKEQIRQLALENGFKLKEQSDGNVDLNPYVYDFVAAVLEKAVPDGFVVVPEDATEVMIQQGDNEVDHNGHGTSVAAVWDAMIQAAQESQ